MEYEDLMNVMRSACCLNCANWKPVEGECTCGKDSIDRIRTMLGYGDDCFIRKEY